MVGRSDTSRVAFGGNAFGLSWGGSGCPEWRELGSLLTTMEMVSAKFLFAVLDSTVVISMEHEKDLLDRAKGPFLQKAITRW